MPDVLVVGAGPVGLTLALQAHRHGASVRIVERRTEPFRPSRALIVHPRTLEVLRSLGVAPALLARSDMAPRARLHVGATSVPVEIRPFGWGDTAFPHLTMITQMSVETVLAAALTEHGVPIEWGTELKSFADEGDRVRARLRSAGGSDETPCAFLAGCDGADSTVRRLAGIGRRGRPYRQEILLADVDLRGDLEPGVAHVVVARSGVVFVFALGERARWRLLVARPGDGALGEPGADELQAVLDQSGLDARITRTAWSSRVRLRHGVATSYRRGRVLLAGDAAHVHSPAAAQGMNTGIQDATNLGWKLAFAGHSGHAAELLDSYETERRPVAGRILAMTDAVFWAESAGGAASLLRGAAASLAGPVLPWVLRTPGLLSLGGRVLSQLWVRYPTGPLALDERPAGRGLPPPGERLPDEEVTCGDERLPVHRLLERPGVHVLLQRDAADPPLTAPGPYVHLHRRTDWAGTGVVAVRPDGHVGYRCGVVDDRLPAWLARIGAVAAARPLGERSHG